MPNPFLQIAGAIPFSSFSSYGGKRNNTKRRKNTKKRNSRGKEPKRFKSQEEEKGNKVGLIKVKTIRPWPREQIIAASKHAKVILVPEFNQAGWLHKEVCTTLYGHTQATIYNGPRVYGGMTMPTELILDWLKDIREKDTARNHF